MNKIKDHLSLIISCLALIVSVVSAFYIAATYKQTFDSRVSIKCTLNDDVLITNESYATNIQLTSFCDIANISNKNLTVIDAFPAFGPSDSIKYVPGDFYSINDSKISGLGPDINKLLETSETATMSASFNLTLKENIAKNAQTYCKDKNNFKIYDFITNCANLPQGGLFDVISTFGLEQSNESKRKDALFIVVMLQDGNYFIDKLPTFIVNGVL